ncbi:MAG: TetR family transcriptional regulator [Marmoricola sp.]
MARWEPDAAGRLSAAALELYLEQGFAETTVAQIAERAGVTARTFFRYFADKREVLFGGSEVLRDLMVGAVAAAPPDASPMAAVRAALDASVAPLTRDPAFSRRRHAVVTANADLRERELMKMDWLGAELTGALEARGVEEHRARLAAASGIAVFRVAWNRWVTGPEADLADVLHQTLAELTGLASG